MSLTPEERQRIYEEEKARVEVQEQLRRQKKSGEITAGQFFCLTPVVLFIILIIVAQLNFHFGGGREREEERRTRGDTIAARDMAVGFVKKRLKAPSTAEFSSEFSGEETATDLGNNKFKVTGWVDSQNSFGAKLRSKWAVVLHYEGNDQWKAEKVNIDSP